MFGVVFMKAKALIIINLIKEYFGLAFINTTIIIIISKIISILILHIMPSLR